MSTVPHREHIGGAWDEIGKLQFDWMVAHGLKPDSRLLDYGCGSGRGAVHFVKYLVEPYGYYLGVDQDASMLEAGVKEVMDCMSPPPKMGEDYDLLDVDQVFPSGVEWVRFDFAICQSVFTHCSPEQIAVIMGHMDLMLQPEGVLYATWFKADTMDEYINPKTHAVGGRTTHFDRDPYHQMDVFWTNQPWSKDWDVKPLGEWDHPRGQQMLEIRRTK